MKKDTLRALIVLAVVLVMYNIAAFMIPFVKTAVFWVSWSFTLVAFAVVSVSIYIAFIKKPDAKSRFYGFPIARIGVIYGAVQLVAGVAVMALAAIVPAWAAALGYAIALGVAVIGLVSADAVVEEIHVQDAKLKKDVTLMRGLQSKVNQLAAQWDNAALKALAEEFRYSDPVSSEALAEAEADLSAVVDELQAAFVDGGKDAAAQLCRKASALLAERNRLCKLNKN